MCQLQMAWQELTLNAHYSLYGISILQTYRYMRTHLKDTTFIRTMVRFWSDLRRSTFIPDTRWDDFEGGPVMVRELIQCSVRPLTSFSACLRLWGWC